MADTGPERRTCRCCGESYGYPERKSVATRAYCENCVQIPQASRKAMGRLRRRLERLAKKVEM